MTNNTETTEGLPFVTEEVINVFGRDILKHGKESENYSPPKEFIERLEIDNPHLFRFLYELIEGHKNLPEADASMVFAAGVGMTYELLRRQSEVNKLEKSIR